MEVRTLLLSIFMLAIVNQVTAQYEECSWECETYDCELFGLFCDYDCFEDCYDYSPAGVLTRGQVVPNRKSKSVTPVAVKTRKRTGKSFRMRIERPLARNIQNGRTVISRGAPPKSFALTQSCLSNKFRGTGKI